MTPKPEDKGPNFAQLYQEALVERDAARVMADVYRDVLRQVAEHAPIDPGSQPTLLGSVCLLAKLALEKTP